MSERERKRVKKEHQRCPEFPCEIQLVEHAFGDSSKQSVGYFNLPSLFQSPGHCTSIHCTFAEQPPNDDDDATTEMRDGEGGGGFG